MQWRCSLTRRHSSSDECFLVFLCLDFLADFHHEHQRFQAFSEDDVAWAVSFPHRQYLVFLLLSRLLGPPLFLQVCVSGFLVRLAASGWLHTFRSRLSTSRLHFSGRLSSFVSLTSSCMLLWWQPRGGPLRLCYIHRLFSFFFEPSSFRINSSRQEAYSFFQRLGSHSVIRH